MLDASASRRILAAGILLAVVTLVLLALLGFPPPAAANPFDPPTQARAQRIIGSAYDRELRPRHGKQAGITTRCRGRRVIVCSVHVYRDNEHLFWALTRLRFVKGSVRTQLDSELRGWIAVPHHGGSVTYFTSAPLEVAP